MCKHRINASIVFKCEQINKNKMRQSSKLSMANWLKVKISLCLICPTCSRPPEPRASAERASASRTLRPGRFPRTRGRHRTTGKYLHCRKYFDQVAGFICTFEKYLMSQQSVAKHDDAGQHREELPRGGDDGAGQGAELAHTHEDEELEWKMLI